MSDNPIQTIEDTPVPHARIRLLGVTLPNTEKAPFSALSLETRGNNKTRRLREVRKRRLLRHFAANVYAPLFNPGGQTATRQNPKSPTPDHGRALFSDYHRRQFTMGVKQTGRPQ